MSHILLLSVFCGVLFGFSFILPNGSFIIFGAFVPLFYVYFGTNRFLFKILGIYISLLIGNIISTYWLYNAFFIGPLLLQLINPIFYTIVLAIALKLSDGTKYPIKVLSFILGWLSVEYIHYNWELSFVLLHLGNVLGGYCPIIQWYEYTGTLGGTLWILIVNFILYTFLIRKSKNSLKWAMLSCIMLPIFMSLYLYIEANQTSEVRREVVVVHPNMDCRNDLSRKSDIEKVQKYISLAKLNITTNTSFLLFPENAIREVIFIPYLVKSKPKLMIDSAFKKFEALNILTGYILFEQCENIHLAKKQGRIFTTHFSNGNPVFCYNTVCHFIPGDSNFKYRSKKKIVPVEETIPYYTVLKNIRKLIPSLGGYFFTYSANDSDILFTRDSIGFTSLICYESGFGEYCSKMSLKGAQVFFVHVNEGWYKSITGAKFFQKMARIRAIESRRYVIRSSNDGISDLINEKGDVIHEELSFKPLSFKGNLLLFTNHTFYSIYGDWLGKLSVLGYFLILLLCRIPYFRLK